MYSSNTHDFGNAALLLYISDYQQPGGADEWESAGDGEGGDGSGD